MLNPYVAIAGILILVGTFWGGWWAGAKINESNWLAREVALKAAEEGLTKAREADRAQIAKVLAEEVSKIQVVNRTINQKAIHEIQHVPVYTNADCAIPPSGVRLINEARGHSLPSGTGGVIRVPVPAAPERRTPSTRPSVTGANRFVCNVPGVRCTS